MSEKAWEGLFYLTFALFFLEEPISHIFQKIVDATIKIIEAIKK